MSNLNLLDYFKYCYLEQSRASVLKLVASKRPQFGETRIQSDEEEARRRRAVFVCDNSGTRAPPMYFGVANGSHKGSSGPCNSMKCDESHTHATGRRCDSQSTILIFNAAIRDD